jgi:hypothetical protein
MLMLFMSYAGENFNPPRVKALPLPEMSRIPGNAACSTLPDVEYNGGSLTEQQVVRSRMDRTPV